MSWSIAPSLDRLLAQTDDVWPSRDHTSDGGIGDAAHSSRESDHNPDAAGIVHARDFDTDGMQSAVFLAAVIGHPAVWYVINRSTIWSRTTDWRPLAYTGSNPHEGHVHISILYTTAAEQWAGAWFAGTPAKTRSLHPVDVGDIRRAFQAREAGHGVKRVQAALNNRLRLGTSRRKIKGAAGAELTADGVPGDATRAAYKAFEGYIGVKSPNGLPARPSLTELGRGRFRVK